MCNERHDIQEVNIKAEQLNFLMQTMHAHHEEFDKCQLNALLGLAYDIAGYVYSWTEEEEKAVAAKEELKREALRNEQRN